MVDDSMSRYLQSRRTKHCQSWDCPNRTIELCEVCGKGFCDGCWEAHETKHPRMHLATQTEWPEDA